MAEDDHDFIPDSFVVQTSEDKSTIRLVWEQDSGGRQAVILQRNQIQPVLLELQKQIPAGNAVPINKGSIRPDATYQVSGLGFDPRSADRFVLTVHLELPDEGRGVSMPLSFSKKDVEECIEVMTKWVETQAD